MKTRKRLATFLVLLMPMLSPAVANEIPFSLEDRDRIIRTEQKVEALDEKIDQKVDDLRYSPRLDF